MINGDKWVVVAVVCITVGAAWAMLETHARTTHKGAVTQDQLRGIEKQLDRIEERQKDIQKFIRMWGQRDR